MLKQYFNIKELSKNVYHIYAPFNDSDVVCSTLVVGTKKALLIDTGSGLGSLKEAVHLITDLPIIVLNTHGHIDHVNGNYEFNEVYIHKDDINIKNKYQTPEVKSFLVECFKHRDLTLPEGFSSKEFILRKDKSFLIALEDGYLFDLGNRELEVINTPGHTKGSISLLDRKNKLLFSGDTISSQVLMYLDESTSINEYINTLEKLNKLDFKTIIASHYLSPYKKDIIPKLIHCAKNISVSESSIYKNPMNPFEGLIYSEGGNSFMEPNVISIVYTKDKL